MNHRQEISNAIAEVSNHGATILEGRVPTNIVSAMLFIRLFPVQKARKSSKLSGRQTHRHLSMRSEQSRFLEDFIRNRQNKLIYEYTGG